MCRVELYKIYARSNREVTIRNRKDTCMAFIATQFYVYDLLLGFLIIIVVVKSSNNALTLINTRIAIVMISKSNPISINFWPSKIRNDDDNDEKDDECGKDLFN